MLPPLEFISKVGGYFLLRIQIHLNICSWLYIFNVVVFDPRIGRYSSWIYRSYVHKSQF